MSKDTTIANPPLWSWLLLHRPDLIQKHLHLMEEKGLIEKAPNLTQVLGYVVYMWTRILFRSQTVGTNAEGKVRETPGAKFLLNRTVRLPFLFATRAINPQDVTGLGLDADCKIRHLIHSHHEKENALYDLAVVSLYPGKLEELKEKLEEILEESTPKSRFIRDLAVYEDYHQRMLELVNRCIEQGVVHSDPEDANNPDISITAFAKWCLKQPDSPEAVVNAIVTGGLNYLKPSLR